MQANNYNTNLLAVMGRQFSSLPKAKMKSMSNVLHCCLCIGALAVAFDTQATSELADHFSSDLDNYSEINITNASYGVILITQESDGVRAKNIAKVTQKYGHGNEVTLTQHGTRNATVITQSGTNNDAAVDQIGNGNTAILVSFGLGHNTANVVQNGDDNVAKAAQWGLSEVSINQQGDRNRAIVGPVGVASVEINQTGNDQLKIIPPPGFINIVVNQ
jgi:minor curlin subunit